MIRVNCIKYCHQTDSLQQLAALVWCHFRDEARMTEHHKAQ